MGRGAEGASGGGVVPVTRLAHYYHAYLAQGWRSIVTEHLDALTRSGLAERLGILHLGLVGTPSARAACARLCQERMPVEVTAEEDEGWEQTTLTALHRAATQWDAVLYAHTKGVSNPRDEWAATWRRSMTLALVAGWQECVRCLYTCEAVGCHWLTPGWYDIVLPRYRGRIEVHAPFFGGNFWWAQASLIQRLNPPLSNTRHDAEMWIGSALPMPVHDCTPGWPNWSTWRLPGGVGNEPVRVHLGSEPSPVPPP